MHYYQFNIGDYNSHAARLSPIQDLAYRRMLDEYYLHERPLNGCSTSVARDIGLCGYEEDVEYVLSRFFKKDGDNWVQNRIEREILTYRDKLEKRAIAGKASAAARNRRMFNRRSTDVQLTNNQEPITNIEAQTRKRFVPPTVEQVYEYMITKGFDKESEAVKFLNYWESVGWMRGRSKMKCWKATARTWMQTYWERANGQRA